MRSLLGINSTLLTHLVIIGKETSPANSNSNMELTKILGIVFFVTLIYWTEAFLPNHAGIALSSNDYTLTDLTVAGIVRAVARYFEDSNPDRYQPGDLIGLDPLTPSHLFQKHYGGNRSVLGLNMYMLV